MTMNSLVAAKYLCRHLGLDMFSIAFQVELLEIDLPLVDFYR